MAVATNPINPPKNANGLPIKCANAPIVPFLAVRPITYSTIISGMLHMNRNMTQATRNAPAPSSPPFEAAIRGNLHILPVPTAIPNALTKKANRDEKRGDELDILFPFNFFEPQPNLEFDLPIHLTALSHYLVLYHENPSHQIFFLTLARQTFLIL